MSEKAKNISKKYVNFLERKHKIILLLFLVIVIFFGIKLFSIKVDLTTESFLFKDDPKLIQYREFRHFFGNDEMVLVAVTGDVFTNEFIEKLYYLQKDYEAKLPFFKESTSIINVSQLYTEENEWGESTLYVDELLKDFPEKKLSQQELDDLKHLVLNDPVFKNRIISEDGITTMITIQFHTPQIISQKDSLQEKDFLTHSNSAGSQSNSDNNVTSGEKQDSFEDLDVFFDENIGSPTVNTEDSVVLPNSVQQAIQDKSSIYFTNAQYQSIYNVVRDIRNQYNRDNFHIAVVGTPLLIPSLLKYLLRDLLTFLPIIFVVIILFTLFMFRRPSALLFSIWLALLTNVFMVGLMSTLKVPMTFVTNILPLIMLTMSVGAIIHLLVLIYKQYDLGHSKADAISFALSHSGWPLLLTTTTSSAGIFSFYFSSIKPMQDFAIFGSLGLVFSLLITILIIPCMILVLPIKRKTIIKHASETSSQVSSLIAHQKMDAVLVHTSQFSFKKSRSTLLLSFIIIATSLFGIKNIQFSHKPIEWLPKDTQFRQDSVHVDKVMKGSFSLEVFIDTKQDNGVLEPSFLNKLERFDSIARSYHSEHLKVGNVVSITSLIKKTNKALHDNNQAFYNIPKSKNLIAQEMLLLENGGQKTLSSIVDLNYRYARISVIVPDLDAVYFSKFLDYIDEKLNVLFEGDHYSYYTTGSIGLLTRVINATIQSAKISYLIAFIVISILMMLLTKSIMVGLVSMLPNLLPIFVLLGIIGFTSIQLDMFVLLIGCILLGLAVDNTIHFIHVYRNYYQSGMTKEEGIKNTFLSTGKAMLTASIILCAGFIVFWFARMLNFKNFGFLSTVGIVVALFADFFLTPALMMRVIKKTIILTSNLVFNYNSYR